MSSATRTRGILLGAVGGAFLTLAVVTAGFIYFAREDTPPLTPEALQSAIERWKAHGPKSYNLDLAIIEGRPGVVHVEVRDGEVTAMTRDGVTPEARRTWNYWTVEGQFDMIDEELDKGDDATQYGAPAGSVIVRRAKFHPELGYPIVYHRQILGTRLEVRWETTRFEAIDDAPPAGAAP